MSLTYLDEDLPEIEITEIITGDEYINQDENRKTGINAYSPDKIYTELRSLLKSLQSIPLSRKTSIFQKLHSDIIAEKSFTIPHFIIPEVSIQRRDNGDEEAFFEACDEAQKLKRHDLRREGFRKAFIGFETTDEDEPFFPSKLPKTVVFIKNTAKNMTVILPSDDLGGTVSQLFTKIYSNENITLVDKINLIISISEKGVQIDSALSLEENIRKITLEPPLEEIDTEKPFKNLTSTKHHSSIPLVPLDECSIHGFYKVQQRVFNKLQPVLEKFKDDLIDVYYGFIDAQVNQPEINTTIPHTAYDIAVMLLEQKTTIEEVTNTIKSRIFSKQRDFIEEWYSFIESWDVQDILPILSFELDIAEKTLHSITDDPIEQWTSINEEIKYIKRGEVISKDFAETLIHENPINDENLVYDEDELPPIYEDELPVDISHLDEGTRELYEIVLKMFIILQRATGLQLDYIALTMSIPIQIRRTRDVQTITDVEFIRQLQYQWTYLLAWWICNLQEKVLSHRLQFQIWEGSMTSIHLWSPYGAPMEKPQKEGIVPYILSVIHELVNKEEETYWKKYTKITSVELNTLLTDLFNDSFKNTVLQLQTTFKTFEKDLPLKNLIKKGSDIKEKLTETVEEKNKANYINVYMNYLKNLPAILVSVTSNKLHSGCCLQKVTDITNEKATYFKKAHKLKLLFATERVGFSKRPTLLQSGLMKEEQGNATLVFNKPPPKEYQDWTITDVPEVSQIEKVIDIVGKTTPIETFLKDFIFKNATTNELLQSIVKLSQIQYLHINTQYIEKPVEYAYLTREFNFYNNDISQNNSMNELQNIQYLRTLQNRFANQLCFPAKAENARNNTLVLIDDGLDASLLKNFVKFSLDAIKEWVFNKTFNMSVNYTEYIEKMREQDKNNLLLKLDLLSPEDKKLYKDGKSLGIVELQDFLEAHTKDPYEDGEVLYEDRGENDDEHNEDALNEF